METYQSLQENGQLRSCEGFFVLDHKKARLANGSLKLMLTSPGREPRNVYSLSLVFLYRHGIIGALAKMR